MKTYYIYTLTDSHKNTICYVGVTTNPTQREYDHNWVKRQKYPLCTYKKMDGTPVPSFPKYLQVNNVTLYMEIIEEVVCSKNEALRIEEYWIQQFKAWGFPLLNEKGLPSKPDYRKYTTA